MDEESKARIRSAVEKYTKKEDPSRVKRKNEAPERELQQAILKHFNSMGWDISNIESKAHWSVAAGAYMSQHQMPGLPDIIGNDPLGAAVYIEVKAPGRRNTLRSNQREFLIRKIKTHCFAVVADSISYVSKYYTLWTSLKIITHHTEAQAMLLAELPPEKAQPELDLFPEE